MTEDELNEAKLELERERFESEKKIAAQESRFFYRNFATVISAAISIAALSVSISQVWVAKIEKQREIDQAKAKAESELELARERDDRKWNYDALQFVSSNKDAIFGGDELQQKRIRDVMVVTFPVAVTDILFPGFKERAKTETEKKIWDDGEKSADSININSSSAPQVDLPANILNKDELVKQLTSAERLSVSNRLIELYSQNKNGVVDALINAILPQADRNSYRNNLYIAVTLARIPGKWEGSAAQLEAIVALKKTGNYHDATFQQWVNKAESNHKLRQGG
jgi:hypothetical protein